MENEIDEEVSSNMIMLAVIIPLAVVLLIFPPIMMSLDSTDLF